MAVAMGIRVVVMLLMVICYSPTSSQSQSQYLSLNHYQSSCPNFLQIMEQTTTNKQLASPTTAAAVLRLFLHDCLVEGCDASILISSTRFSTAERDHDINLSLPGDAFDLVTRAKTALELSCPSTVSCADILAVAARNLVVMLGGPHYDVLLGRRDGLVSRASRVVLPRPSMSISQISTIFTSKGFSIQEMVALTGAHTVGLSHCKEFSSDIFNFSASIATDPSYNPRFASGLRNACANYVRNPTLSVFNDIMSPNNFDNNYFQNLPKGLGVLASDRGLVSDARTRPFVELYGKDHNQFFEAFRRAMEKLSLYGVKTAKSGQIRRRCDAFN